jgi:hypothetical protein
MGKGDLRKQKRKRRSRDQRSRFEEAKERVKNKTADRTKRNGQG